MAIQRPDPLRSLVELQDRMNRLFEETLSRSFEVAGPDSSQPTAWQPPVDLYEEPERYVLRADLPGVAAADIHLQVADGNLVVSGERKVDDGVGREAFLRVERQHGRFSLQVSLPPSVEQGAIRASHRNGVLEVDLPKKKEDVAGKIQVDVS
jgi:HSP20 family protein